MQVQPYLTFYGRADEALQFYEKALGAKTMFKMHFKDAPPNPDYPMTPEMADKVMHASFTIGESMIMCSDGDCSQPAGAAQGDDHAHEHERDRVVDQMREADMQKRGSKDRPHVVDVARVDAAGRIKLVVIDRVDRLDHPHHHDDRQQQDQALDRLTALERSARARGCPWELGGAAAHPHKHGTWRPRSGDRKPDPDPTLKESLRKRR